MMLLENIRDENLRETSAIFRNRSGGCERQVTSASPPECVRPANGGSGRRLARDKSLRTTVLFRVPP